MNRYKELRVWQDAVELCICVYAATKRFPDDEKFGMVSQLNRAVVSISSNIAEGAGRNSPKEFRQFLSISTGSAFEVESLTEISLRLGYIAKKDYENILSKVQLIQNMLYKLQQTLG